MPTSQASSAASANSTVSTESGVNGLRDATHQERAALAQLGRLELNERALAFDLPKGRSLVGAVLTHEGAPTVRHAGMAVTYESRIALVTCGWDGSDAIGVDVGSAGQRGVAALRQVFGDELCDPWIVSSPGSRG